MKNNITIKVDKLNEIKSLKIVNALRNLISKLSFMDLRRLSTITICSNFTKEVLSYSIDKKNNFNSKIKVSNNSYASVFTFQKRMSLSLFFL